ncbi:hypothetical protein CAEBREN_14931 [Caenorhabditis brenneri]|uniref:Uncharacterized protein n=1 Tax=Caenorhabditis brenneri TaxID=135651 RepID=G0N156_CAEBE|nr:hypothetical protein CAEBREN_14931 [Caenorhabditis brenneri]
MSEDELTEKYELNYRWCLVTVDTYSIVGTYSNGSYQETKNFYKHEKFMELNEVEFSIDSSREDRKMERCVETEPGHVAVVKVTEEGEDMRVYRHTYVGCTYKNQFHEFASYWKDLEMGAVLSCDQGNKVTKPVCLINGTEYHTDPNVEHKLSNGCTFICHSQKNIYKCPDQLKYMEVMETATTRIPTTLRAEFGF